MSVQLFSWFLFQVYCVGNGYGEDHILDVDGNKLPGRDIDAVS